MLARRRLVGVHRVPAELAARLAVGRVRALLLLQVALRVVHRLLLVASGVERGAYRPGSSPSGSRTVAATSAGWPTGIDPPSAPRSSNSSSPAAGSPDSDRLTAWLTASAAWFAACVAAPRAWPTPVIA